MPKGLNNRILQTNSSNLIGGVVSLKSGLISIPNNSNPVVSGGRILDGIFNYIGTDGGRVTYSTPVYTSANNAITAPIIQGKVLAISYPNITASNAQKMAGEQDPSGAGLVSIEYNLCTDSVGFGLTGSRSLHNYYFQPTGLGFTAPADYTIAVFGLREAQTVVSSSSVIFDTLQAAVSGGVTYKLVAFNNQRFYRQIRLDLTRGAGGALTNFTLYGNLRPMNLPLSL